MQLTLATHFLAKLGVVLKIGRQGEKITYFTAAQSRFMEFCQMANWQKGSAPNPKQMSSEKAENTLI
jgi:hypothetical protein